MSRPPPKRPEPPTLDNPSVLTVYASDCPSIMEQHGVITLVFTEMRAIGAPPKLENRIVARVALPMAAAAAMNDRVRTVLFGQQTVKAGGPAN